MKLKRIFNDKILVLFYLFLVCACTPSLKDIDLEKRSYIQEQFVFHKNCLGYCPFSSSDNNIVVDHDIIILSANIKTKFADWVAYKIEVNNLKGPQRARNWNKDPMLDKEITLIPSDYKGLGLIPYLFDRGHQAPLAAFKNHDKWYVVNYLSNITPQKRELNQGAWKNLEERERNLAQKFKEIFVLTGPYYSEVNRFEGPDNKRIDYIIPSGYWKIIYVGHNGKYKAIAFTFDQNTRKHESYCRYINKISAIEKIANLKVFNDSFTVQENLHKEIGCH